MQQRVALSHASGLAADAILEKLADSSIETEALVLLDDANRAGKRLAFRNTRLSSVDQSHFDFSDCALLLLPEDDEDLALRAEAGGCFVASHALAGDTPAVFAGASESPTIPFNSTRLRLAGPALSCLAPALLELDRLSPLARVHTVLLRSAEFHGKAGVDELASQTINLLNSREVTPGVFPLQIAFNLLAEGTDPRWSGDLVQILGNNSCFFSLQSINVPVFHGFAAALQVGFDASVRIEDCFSRLGGLDRLTISSRPASPISDCNQSFSCVISHLEQAPGQPACVQFWMLADPLRYGLATNYMHVTEFLLKSFL